MWINYRVSVFWGGFHGPRAAGRRSCATIPPLFSLLSLPTSTLGVALDQSPDLTILESLPWTSRILLSYDISNAMAFLHERKYIHRDLKSPNILLRFSPERERESGGGVHSKSKGGRFWDEQADGSDPHVPHVRGRQPPMACTRNY